MEQMPRKRKSGGGGDCFEQPENISATEVEEDGDGDMLSRLLNWLEEEETKSAVTTQDSVAINGDDESCGSSFSAAAATVMVGVDTGGARGMLPFFYGCDSRRPSVMDEYFAGEASASVAGDGAALGVAKIGA
ncbi:hypothetical protein HPP92_023667 [Vanilla planifolia]|uniref:Uncharacterized protein n=1 Tax=Vanilla planifolia TaxID=51239 RepID=A0A835PQG9_VANPL|nr:hypothetical protein HPP92_024009 [Vanilla planifolia]KAG0455879.1 hypothetical protein HPP92_023667 [Vanilla planifolia]